MSWASVRGLLQLEADLDPGADLLGEHPGAARAAEGVELALQFLLGGRAASIANPDRLTTDPRLGCSD